MCNRIYNFFFLSFALFYSLYYIVVYINAIKSEVGILNKSLVSVNARIEDVVEIFRNWSRAVWRQFESQYTIAWYRYIHRRTEMKARNMNSRGIFGYDGIYVNIVHRSKELKETINVFTDEVVTDKFAKWKLSWKTKNKNI